MRCGVQDRIHDEVFVLAGPAGGSRSGPFIAFVGNVTPAARSSLPVSAFSVRRSERPGGGRGSCLDTKFAKDVLEVLCDGGRTSPEYCRGVFIRLSPRDPCQHLGLTLRQAKCRQACRVHIPLSFIEEQEGRS
jgi:hypothetical protein